MPISSCIDIDWFTGLNLLYFQFPSILYLHLWIFVVTLLPRVGDVTEVPVHWGVHEDVYCAGKESTFEFLEGVLKEVISLFPSQYIHIGGDEVLLVHLPA